MTTIRRREAIKLLGGAVVAAATVGVVDKAAALELGKPAPDFTLPSASSETISLKQYRGQKIVLVEFFGSASAPTCMSNVKVRGADTQKFADLNVQIIAISSDSPFALKTYADSVKIQFPLLSDQGLQTIRRYEVLAPDNVRALRAFFLIDEQGMLRKQWLLGLAGDDIVFASAPLIAAVQELKTKR